MSFSVRSIDSFDVEKCSQRMQMIFPDERGNVVVCVDWDEQQRIVVDKIVWNASGDELDRQMYSVDGNVDQMTYMEILRAVGFLALDPARMRVLMATKEEASPNLLHEPVRAPNVFQVHYV